MTPDETTESLRAAQRGDSAAAASFVRGTQADVWRFLAHCVSRAEADDLTQEAYLRAFRALPAYRGEASARTWLLAIARRVASDHLRARGRRPLLVHADLAQDSPAPDDASGDVVNRDLVARLGPERRAAFVLTQVLGFSYAETASVCDCPIGTVRSRVARAREELIAAMQDPGVPVVPDVRRGRPPRAGM